MPLSAALARERGLPRRVGRVFRDEEEVPASPHLSKVIETALQASRTLVVLCSPRASASAWVNREVERFRELGRGDGIFALLLEGEPGEAFPPALREIRRSIADPRGAATVEIEATEPLAADVRPMPGESRRVRRRHAPPCP